MIWTVPPIWEGGSCWIIGGGTSIPKQFGVPSEIVQKVYKGQLSSSAYSEWMKPLHNAHVIGINNAYQIGTWIDILFFGDNSWYLVHAQRLRQWPGLKIGSSSALISKPASKMDGLKCLARDKGHREGISSNPSMISWNGNSGAAAISIARHLGVKRIFLLGFDMRMDEKAEYSHWHGSHLPPGQKLMKQPPFNRHLKGFPAIARDAKQMGISIYNVNPESAIDNFPKVTLQEALDGSAI